MKKGIFPHFAEGLQTTSDDENWDGVSGFVKISGSHAVTFNTANYNGPDEPVIESGTAIFVQNSHSGTATAVITGGQLGDADGATAEMNAGEAVTILYHEDHGFVFLGGVEVVLGA
jgi:hypothetical protein